MVKSGSREKVPSTSGRRVIQLQGPRPAPLKIKRDAANVPRRPPLAPEMVHQRQKPVVIYAKSPPVIHAQAQDFMQLVQRLTGQSGDQPKDANSTNIVKNSDVIDIAGDELDEKEVSVTDEEKESCREEQKTEALASPLFTPPSEKLDERPNFNLFDADLPFFTPTPNYHHSFFLQTSSVSSLPLPSPSPAPIDLFNHQPTN